jgi:hypothetical protein
MDAGNMNPTRQHWTKIIGISEDGEQVMRAIVQDAWRRIREIDVQARQEGEEYLRDPTPERREKLYAHGKEMGEERTEILDETIAKLRQELSEDDFRKLDAWVYRVYGYHPNLPQPSQLKSATRVSWLRVTEHMLSIVSEYITQLS